MGFSVHGTTVKEPAADEHTISSLARMNLQNDSQKWPPITLATVGLTSIVPSIVYFPNDVALPQRDLSVTVKFDIRLRASGGESPAGLCCHVKVVTYSHMMGMLRMQQ